MSRYASAEQRILTAHPLIERIKLLDRQDVTSPFERVLRMQHAEGKIDHQTLKFLLEAHQAEIARERNEWERSPR